MLEHRERQGALQRSFCMPCALNVRQCRRTCRHLRAAYDHHGPTTQAVSVTPIPQQCLHPSTYWQVGVPWCVIKQGAGGGTLARSRCTMVRSFGKTLSVLTRLDMAALIAATCKQSLYHVQRSVRITWCKVVRHVDYHDQTDTCRTKCWPVTGMPCTLVYCAQVRPQHSTSSLASNLLCSTGSRARMSSGMSIGRDLPA